MSPRCVEFQRRWRCEAVLARRHASFFVSILVAGEVLRDCCGRPTSLDPELAEIIASERWETDPSFPEVPSRFALESLVEKDFGCQMVFRRTAMSSDLKPGPWSKQPSAQHTASRFLDCGMLLHSDNLSIELCFNPGRSRDFRLLPFFQTFFLGVSGAQHQKSHKPRSSGSKYPQEVA